MSRPASSLQWVERIAVLEQKVAAVSEELADQNKKVMEELRSTETKLDELLALKHKGMGAFWLASLIGITGILSWLSSFVQWVKG